MSDGPPDQKPQRLTAEVRDLKIERSVSPHDPQPMEAIPTATSASPPNGATPSAQPPSSRSSAAPPSESRSPVKPDEDALSPGLKAEHEELVGGGITVKMEPGKAPKLTRTSSKKIVSRPPALFLDSPDATEEATQPFEVIDDCIYANKYMGSTDPAIECECSEEWDPESRSNRACGEDSDCINRATKMECIGDCSCGVHCQNQRFQHREYAQVSVIKTDKKGYGLRTNADLRPGDFVFEYLGEVVGEAAFRRRTRQYDDEGIKHFYFMSLTKGEFIDATRKGNLGRFCNHSCNPNCYVDKWVVGDKLRMGIFAERHIKTGEELVFNYNVDRYGADPQPCYCGEPNCTGFIGGKTQTERSTKLSHDTIEALGIEDADDWDTAVARRPRKRKTGEDDEEYVDSVQPKSLAEDGVTKVMATLMQCKEKWIAVKLLNRIQRVDDERVRNRVVKMHGYRILKTALSNFMDDVNVVLQILEILFKLPRITRNKIQDSKIEETVGQLTSNENEQVASKAAHILDIWSKLEVGYRIPRLKRDPNAAPQARQDRFERREPGREREKSRSRSRSPVAPRGPSQPGARQNRFGGQGPSFRRGQPFARKRDRDALPDGWFPAADSNGKTYYYNAMGTTTWTRPTQPAAAPPPPPSQAVLQQQKLDEIIKGITAENAKKLQNTTPKQEEPPKEEVKPRKEKQEKWKSLPEDKQKKIYENTLFPHIKYVVDKFKHKLPKDDLKRLAKELSKKLVNSDYKNNRVPDPTKISPKQEKVVKKFAADFFNKAYAKKKAHDKRKAERASAGTAAATSTAPDSAKTPDSPADNDQIMAEIDAEMADLPDKEREGSGSPALSHASSQLSAGTKRKREADEGTSDTVSPEDDPGSASPKKQKFDTPPPPPPPPPPPAGEPGPTEDDFADTSAMTTDVTRDESSIALPSRVEDIASEHQEAGKYSPWQLATPPTNGSSDKENGLHPNQAHSSTVASTKDQADQK